MKSIVRAWKDPIFRATLSTAEQSALANPAGVIELTGTDLDAVAGGGGKHHGGKGKGSKKSSKSSKSGGSGKSGRSSRSSGSGKCCC